MNSKEPSNRCPQCEQLMHLQRRDIDDDVFYYECRTVSCSKYGELILFKPEGRLSIQAIAEDMTLGFFLTSDELKKKQAHYRRLSGGLSKLDGKQYLTPEEHQHLAETSKILERLATAAEQSKKVKKQKEEREKQRVQSRNSQARSLMKGKLVDDDLKEYILNVAALDLLLNRPDRLTFSHSWQSLCEKINSFDSLSSILKSLSLYEDQVIRELAEKVDYRDEAVEELLERVLNKLPESKDKIRASESLILEMIDKILKIESGGNVVKLHA